MQHLAKTMLTLDEVRISLLSLLIHYPESGLNGKAVTMLANDYYADFIQERVSAAQFKWSLSKVRRSCGFFPKVKDFMEAIEEYRANPPARVFDKTMITDQSLEREWLPEEIEINQKKVGVLIRQANGVITKEVAEKQINDLDKEMVVFKNKMVK